MDRVLRALVAMILSLVEWFQMRTADTLDDSFMGYDFSQGYTSLERSTKPNQPAGRRRRGWLESWRERRRTLKEQRARLHAEQAQQQLDEILAKVHLNGISSLTDAERRQLIRAAHACATRTSRRGSKRAEARSTNDEGSTKH